jgi:hypothetical protein
MGEKSGWQSDSTKEGSPYSYNGKGAASTIAITTSNNKKTFVADNPIITLEEWEERKRCEQNKYIPSQEFISYLHPLLISP